MPLLLLLSISILATHNTLFGAAGGKKDAHAGKNQAELAQMLDAGEFIGKKTDEGQIEFDSESDQEEGFEKVSAQEQPGATLGQLLITGLDATLFIGLRKFCNRRQAIQFIYHTMHKGNPDHTLAYLQTRKEFHPNYYLDVAVSEAKKEGDIAFIHSLELLINRAIELKLEFSQENKAWLYKAKQELKKIKLQEIKTLVAAVAKKRIDENGILAKLRSEIPHSLQDELAEPSDSESNSPEELFAKIVSAP
jgi:hypothetical protein